MFLRSRALNRLLSGARKTTWKEFLRTHWNVIAAADFFTVEVWTLKGLTRYIVFFVLELSTRPSRDRSYYGAARWVLDDSDGSQIDGCGRWILDRQTISDSRSRSVVHDRCACDPDGYRSE
jgi:hypothetical protein